jgi:hypothetical protein
VHTCISDACTYVCVCVASVYVDVGHGSVSVHVHPCARVHQVYRYSALAGAWWGLAVQTHRVKVGQGQARSRREDQGRLEDNARLWGPAFRGADTCFEGPPLASRVVSG